MDTGNFLQAGNPDDEYGDNGGEEIIDEEELNRLKHMKELKHAYRTAYTELKELKNEASF